MFNAVVRPLSVDPWVAPSGSLQSSCQLSRQAAERFSVLQALRERRIASRSARRPPSPGRVEAAPRPNAAQSDVPARTEEYTSVG